MGTPCYVGTTDPTQPGIVRARYVHFDGYPSSLIPQLRGIWAHAARRDTSLLIDAVLAHDWDHLGPDTTTSTPSMPDQHPVAGVGMTLDDSDPEPATVFPLSRAGDLTASWIYLINPADNTVIVHSGDGEPVGVHPLDWPHHQKNETASPHCGQPPAHATATARRARHTHPPTAETKRPA
ncbi:hypothetical protein AB0D32_03470 [Micromonospora sp. NPDC048170]|uniref:hypothetical protein n=1 Tax=Micromonospora sp. NPDC048170 TaxID=3154819 RepID=UPI00340E4D01